jgi:hypothetical protein
LSVAGWKFVAYNWSPVKPQFYINFFS